MYRYTVDNAVTYTPDDFFLYRESPFAVWMERLTLENPDHGILPDLHTSPPEDSAECQGAIVDTLRMEGRDVALIDWDLDEAERRRQTIAAMRDGADFIVDGQLALGALSGTANLLMRTSGYSDLGDFLYIPCDTQDKTTLQSAFRLCFLADLLHSLQGQLPPQMLVIRGDADVVPLQTEDHIYYFLAVKKRFMDDMRDFRKHVMPDPSESAHFGRWSDCASEVMKQRALQEQEEAFEREQELLQEEPALRVASGGTSEAITIEPDRPGVTAQGVAFDSGGQTLAEQARQLDPSFYHVDSVPGPAPNLSATSPGPALAEVHRAAAAAPLFKAKPAPATPAPPPPQARERVHDPLGDLSFIGSNSLSSSFEVEPIEPPQDWRRPAAPIASLDSAQEEGDRWCDEEPGKEPGEQCEARQVPARAPASVFQSAPLPDLEPPEPALLPPEDLVVAASPRQPGKPHPLDSSGVSVSRAGLVDLDGAPPPSLAPLPSELGMDAAKSRDRRDGPGGGSPVTHGDARTGGADPDEVAPRRPFSDSLITSGDFDDD